jgi:RHS repeat-associated protein
MFTARRFDFETSLYYYRAPYYNPYIGRFLQTDPVGYGYAYCGNNPIGMVDPSGLFTIATAAITDDPDLDRPGHNISAIESWLDSIGFNKWYPEWFLLKVSIKYDRYKRTYFDIEFGLRTHWRPEDAESLDFKCTWWSITEDHKYLFAIPIVQLSVPKREHLQWDYVAILTDRQLKDIIRPAIHRVNQ